MHTDLPPLTYANLTNGQRAASQSTHDRTGHMGHVLSWWCDGVLLDDVIVMVRNGFTAINWYCVGGYALCSFTLVDIALDVFTMIALALVDLAMVATALLGVPFIPRRVYALCVMASSVIALRVIARLDHARHSS